MMMARCIKQRVRRAQRTSVTRTGNGQPQSMLQSNLHLVWGECQVDRAFARQRLQPGGGVRSRNRSQANTVNNRSVSREENVVEVQLLEFDRESSGAFSSQSSTCASGNEPATSIMSAYIDSAELREAVRWPGRAAIWEEM